MKHITAFSFQIYKKLIFLTTLCIFSIFLPQFGHTNDLTMYRYVDEEGVIHITNRPDGDQNFKLFIRFQVKELLRSVGPEGIRRLAHTYGYRHGIDPHLVHAVIAVESGYNPNAVSHAGAQGLMQLMPGTASDLGVSRPFDPDANVDGGVRYLRSLLERFQDTRLALAAYNAGPGRVERSKGIPRIKETQDYVIKVLATYNELKQKSEK